ncbi:MAG: hypothetical protein WDM78_16840 [Puia sp.]
MPRRFPGPSSDPLSVPAGFLPAFLAYFVSLKNKDDSPKYFNRIYLVVFLIFGISLFLPPDRQLSRPVRLAQESFFVLKAIPNISWTA